MWSTGGRLVTSSSGIFLEKLILLKEVSPIYAITRFIILLTTVATDPVGPISRLPILSVRYT
jgi:hypothetical protein